MEEKEREIWIGESRIYLGEDNILYIDEVGDIDEDGANARKEAALRLIDKAQKNVKILIDINRATEISSRARQIFKELSDVVKAEKLALVGLHPVARIMASFVLNFSKQKKMRFFSTKEEALVWFME